MHAPIPDVIVVGSGAAGLTAALSAAVAGASVLVLERSPLLGGTSAISGGQIWSPLNYFMERAGKPDDRAEAAKYLARVTLGQVGANRLSRYLDLSPSLLPFLEASTELRFFQLDRPDYHPDFIGARDGRAFEPLPLDCSRLGEWRNQVRTSPVRGPITSLEGRTGLSADVIATRRAADVRTQGAGLVAGLVQACLDRGVSFAFNARITDLVVENGTVRGCRTDVGRVLHCRSAVVLASGGFEWNDALKDAFLAPADRTPTSPPWNEGDGLIMGLRLGAAVAHMTEAWWTAAVQVPGEQWDGRPMARNIVRELALPGSILVNGAGQRFVNEASSYHDLGKAFQHFDPGAYGFPNRTAWLVFDSRFKRRYPVVNVPAAAAAPDWFVRAETLAELAALIGVDASGLEATVACFNEAARRGEDPDYSRGADRHGRFYGDLDHGPNPCLAPLTEAPFFAITILHGNNGTKGGLRTDGDGRVIRFDCSVVAGLFACGNVSAGPMGPGYPGTGGSLGPAMTGALAAGRAAASISDKEARG
jgi:succinate dehydrogenase/fumarate reductase flavoprotein subunit